MAEYITKEQVINWFRPYRYFKISFDTLVGDLHVMKAADVVPMRHGQWNDWEVFWKECSCCGYRTQKINAREYFFCPKCGAKMDGDDVNG